MRNILVSLLIYSYTFFAHSECTIQLRCAIKKIHKDESVSEYTKKINDEYSDKNLKGKACYEFAIQQAEMLVFDGNYDPCFNYYTWYSFDKESDKVESGKISKWTSRYAPEDKYTGDLRFFVSGHHFLDPEVLF